MVTRISRNSSPRPFLKWAGGKRSLLPEILDRIPPGPIDFYLEPFLGGGALFLELARRGRIRQAVLNDRNPQLIEVWRQVRDCPAQVIEAVHQWHPDEETYYSVRALEPALLTAVERAARLIWLNRTCFNGLYRINRRGQFNVPFGKYKRPRLVDEENLYAVSEALQTVAFYDIDFDGILAMAGEGAVVYCDPPYWPVSRTSSFTAYDGNPFRPDDQNRLADAFAALPGQGAWGLLSNSWVPETVALYESHGLHFSQVYARRSINRVAEKRGPVPEIMVTSHYWAGAEHAGLVANT